MNKNYIPEPIDVSEIELPKELLCLSESIAHNVHEVWAAARIADGWRYGEKRDETEKIHSCLIPYNQLSEEEKEYDRKTAIGTLKLIMKLGFKIEK